MKENRGEIKVKCGASRKPDAHKGHPYMYESPTHAFPTQEGV